MAKTRSKSIEAYREKRDFGRTPEPPPEAGAERATAGFVVHRHEARRLHYDLRLEMAGVLKSWAVPRGFSYDPTVKRLAVRTEDHPLAYEEFSGVIPRGEYGGGTMTIWDRGRFELLKTLDGPSAVGAGKLEIRLFGRKLRGEWHLVRTRSPKDEWILFKARDRYARKESEKAPFFDLRDAIEAPPPEEIVPMEASAGSESFSDPDWIFEVEFAGKRVRAFKRDDAITIRDGTDLTGLVPEVVENLFLLRAENAILDGVLVVADGAQRPSREKLRRRLEGSSEDRVVFYPFDLLYYEEWDLRPLPLVTRKEILSTLFSGLAQVLYVDHVQGRGEDFYGVTSAAGLPAVIAKNASSPYTEGVSENWKRIATEPETEAPGRDLMEAILSRPRRSKIQFSNLDKVFWPGEGFTKGDLIRYYEQVADTLMPYLHERPTHMLRYPDGIYGKSFYQKDAPDHTPDWVVTEAIASDNRGGDVIHYIIPNHRDTLIWMANMGSIDLHPWFSRRTTRDSPDWAVFDLDPDGSPFKDVVKIARTLGKVLRGIGLRPYLKTSGASGIHIYVPVKPSYTYEHTKQFCEAVAIHVAAEHKEIATVERVVRRRRGKVYIDFLQNRRGQTVVPPYAVRPQPGAPVSAPLEWDELDLELTPVQFNIKSILPRLNRLGDLFQGSLRDQQDLLPAIEAFQKNYLEGPPRP